LNEKKGSHWEKKMRLKLPAARFSQLTRAVLQFVAKGAALDPGLGLVRLDVGQTLRLRLTAQDTAVGARVLTDRPYEGEAGTVVVSGHHLDRVVSILPESGDLEFFSDGEKLRLSTGRMVVDAPLRPADDLVPFPSIPRDGWHKVEEKRLSDVIKSTLWAVAEGDARPLLAGVNLCARCSQATDGYKLSHLSPGLMPGDEGDVIVPTASWQSLRALVTGSEKTLEMRTEGSRLWLRGRQWAAYTLLVAGKYPDTTPLLLDPVEGIHHPQIGSPVRVHSICVNRHEMLSIVRHIGASSIDRKEAKMGAGVRFDYRRGELHMVAVHTADAAATSIHVDEIANWAEDSVTEGNVIGFENIRQVDFYHEYVKRALESLPSDVVRMMWADGVDIGGMPLQFHDKEGVIAMVMPRRL
jgi:DNA polymerase III sliding clamp (beta) subunit (PCNA family)